MFLYITIYYFILYGQFINLSKGNDALDITLILFRNLIIYSINYYYTSILYL